MIVDAHVHVWSDNTERYPFQPVLGYVPNTPAPLEALFDEMDGAGVDLAVLVQPSVYGWDNRYLADCIREYPDRLAGVCLVDPLADDAADRLAACVENDGFRGVRLNPISDADGVWLNDRSQDLLWEQADRLGTPICVQLLPRQVYELEDMIGRFPGVTVVVDHLAKPAAEVGPASAEAHRFLKLAPYSNVIVKVAALAYLSGQGYPFTDTVPLVQAAVAAFGSNRVIWGSDFPGILRYCTYNQALRFVRRAIADASESERAAILGGNATRLWFDT